MTPIDKLRIEVTFDDKGRVKVVGDSHRGDQVDKRMTGSDQITVDPLFIKGCTMMPPSEVKCPPRKLIINVGWDGSGKMDLIKVRKGRGRAQRKTGVPKRRPTDRRPDPRA